MSSDRFRMPEGVTDEMRNAAYRCYVDRQGQKGYLAFEDICAIFRAAFKARGGLDRCDMCGEPRDGRDHSGCDRAYIEIVAAGSYP
jgi:hypothetical protein